MPEDSQIGVESDNNFIGFSSRLDPSNLKPGFSQASNNMRLQRGSAQPRKGCERLTDDTLNTRLQSGSGYYINAAGQDNIVMLFTDSMILYNTQTGTFSPPYTFPAGRYLPIGTLTSQTDFLVSDIIGSTHTRWLSVPTTVGLKVGDKVKIGYSLDSPNITYTEHVKILKITV